MGIAFLHRYPPAEQPWKWWSWPLHGRGRGEIINWRQINGFENKYERG